MTEYYTRREAADILKVSVKFLEQLAHKNKGPVFHKLNSQTVRYTERDLEAWLQTTRTTKRGYNKQK